MLPVSGRSLVFPSIEQGNLLGQFNPDYVSMGHLLRHTLGVPGSTIEMKTQYFAPIRGPLVRCEARFLHQGQRTHFLEAKMYDADETLAAAATSTWSVRKLAATES